MRPATTKPTARHLLTHTAGFGYDWNCPAHATYRQQQRMGGQMLIKSVEDTVPRRSITDMPAAFDAGSRFLYGASSDWLGLLVEAVSGVDLDTFCQEHIFGPLDISDMSFHALPSFADNHTNVCCRVSESEYIAHPPWFARQVETCQGGAGLRGSPRSFLRILRTLLKGEVDGVRLLSPQALDAMFSPQLSNEAVLQDLATFIGEHCDPFERTDKVVAKNWGLGGALYQDELESGRAAGSMTWSGLACVSPSLTARLN